MKQRSPFCPRVQVEGLLTDTVAAAGLVVGLSAALAPWPRLLRVHDRAKSTLIWHWH